MLRKLFSNKILFNAETIIIFFTAVKLILHLIFSGEYGYFRDEFYYIACSENLAFGYVDHPPLIALITKISILFFGSSLESIRFFSAAAGASILFISGLLIKKISGSRFAILIGMIAILFTPVILASNHTLSMNPLDQFFWTLAFYLLVIIFDEKKDKIWILFGIIIGIALQNNYSILLLIFGLLIGAVLTSKWKYFKNKFFLIGASAAFLIILPNLIWQFKNGFPTVEFANNSAEFMKTIFSPFEFISDQILQIHPNSFILILIGILYLFLSQRLKKYKLFAWCFLSILIVMILTNSKTYYLAALYPAMISFGVISLSYLLENKKLLWLRYSLASFILPLYILVLPMALPVLPVEIYIKYADKLGIGIPSRERHEHGVLQQNFADMFGWENMVETVADVYYSLPEDERKKCGIFTGNYGEAAAINFYRNNYNLPEAISGHNNYWYWGTRDNSFEVMIVLGIGLKSAMDIFEEVEPVDIIFSNYAMPYENNIPVYICKKPKFKKEKLWLMVKHFN